LAGTYAFWRRPKKGSNVPRTPDAEVERELAAFPTVLRNLLKAELATGNSVTEVGHGFPAPPRGAWARLARPVATRPRQSADGVIFRLRNWHAHSFEWSDAVGHFFLLEPPLPPPTQPSMDEIRATQTTRAEPSSPKPPRAAEPPALTPGEYRVDIDYRGEMLTYREAARLADVTCTWGPHPIIMRSSLRGWRHPSGQSSAPIGLEERRTVLVRIVEHLRRQGMAEPVFED
jgi:hypothetical protein